MILCFRPLFLMNFMKTLFLCSWLFLALTSKTFAQYNVIFDTDIDSDVDDVEALAMLHTLADQKAIKFRGVIVTSDDPFAPSAVSALNKYFGRARLPIGFLKNQENLKNQSKYTRQLAEEFPHRLKSHEKAKDATALYRQLLSKSPDNSVVIITVGHLTNLQNLLQSGPDRHSKLSGKELVEQKVARWLCMGGMYPEGKEANFYRPDPLSTVYCLQEWTKPVTFAGWEIGNEVITGGQYLKDRLSPSSPVYRSYELYNNFKGRPSWDQLAVYLLLDDWAQYFDVVSDGQVEVADDGSNVWRSGEKKNHEYLVFKPGADREELARKIDDMVRK
jgi:purine nucleosidase